MRVVAGIAGGTRLKVPAKVTRPTTDRVREAIFSILGSRVMGARVLDLFAGSGALGIEALSRGAEMAVFVEHDRNARSVIGENLEKAGLRGRAEILGMDVFASVKSPALNHGADFDVAFADPPYQKDAPGRPTVPGTRDRADHAARLLGPDGLQVPLLILETEASRVFGDLPGWTLEDQRMYGSTSVWFFHRQGKATTSE